MSLQFCEKPDISVESFKARKQEVLFRERLQLLTSVQHSSVVRKALEKACTEINRVLAETPGRISKLDADVDSGFSGATVRLTLAVDETDLRPKCVFWANEGGGSAKEALQKARKRINTKLSKTRGEIADFYLKFITTPLKRTYATLIVAVNQMVSKPVGALSSDERRERLASVLRLLGNDPRTINIAGVAKALGVSRDTIYHDLNVLGFKRS